MSNDKPVQHEKTVQQSADEARQTEPFQKTRDVAKKQLDQKVVNEANANPSLQNQNEDMQATKSETEQELAANDEDKDEGGENDDDDDDTGAKTASRFDSAKLDLGDEDEDGTSEQVAAPPKPAAKKAKAGRTLENKAARPPSKAAAPKKSTKKVM